ncbi:C6 zinc finger domain-containing protein [Colletotrichum graminicola M1.001]|uniref:C6 zinc finger domain-containing protein n=1 Tax=Colletotrichum graminicola (strain M1.001 / M2 / FGSC 10212) TaxID=645133 RepID=E3Q585_COLGM|nr:C6 zinc finger domain-containing protein [Colletotrichum graminicola M1.001]EFQ25852.1 C6 zinc finger domain-containing protein [Colletotrichum graminicola M1.001]
MPAPFAHGGSRYARTWVTTGPNGQVKEHESASPVWTLPTISHDRPWTQAQEEIPTEMERLPRNDDGIKHPGLSMSDLLSSNQPGISQVHPEPRQIYRSWQVFVESVNPLLKIIHVPTLQQRVLDASWNPDSELTSTPTGAAIRIGQKIGLHLHKAAPKISAFDGEMRVRLWWQLYGIDARTRAAGRSSQPSAGEFGNVCLPLNVNDADLHPEMTELPTEHTGPTEMTCVLVKFEVTNWVRSSARAFVILDLCSQGTARGTKQTGLEEKAIDELEARYHDKFLRYLDHNVPLHALIDLRRRCSGARVALAWRLVEKLYGEHPEMIRDISQNPFFAALGDLTLEAWEAGRKELVDSQETRAAGASPAFIQSIWDQRRNQAVQVSQLLSAPELQNLDAVGLKDNGDLGWEYWNDFLRL